MRNDSVGMSNEKKLKLKKNLFFKNKTLELIYSMQKFDAESRVSSIMLPKGISYNPSELNSTIFVLNSYKEQFEDTDPMIFEHNTKLFQFCRCLRNMLWHRSIYTKNLGEVVENDLFKSMLSKDDWKIISDIFRENEGNNKIEELSISFNLDSEAILKLIVIYNNEEHVFNVIRKEFDLVFYIFENSMISLFNYVYY